MFQLANTIMKLKAGFIGSTEFWENWGYKGEQAEAMDAQFGWVENYLHNNYDRFNSYSCNCCCRWNRLGNCSGVQMARADSTDKREEAKKG